MQNKIDKIRYDISRFIYGYNKIIFNFLNNLSQKIELYKVYNDFSNLFSNQIFEHLQNIISAATPIKGNINYIQIALLHHYLEYKTVELTCSLKKIPSIEKDWISLLTSTEQFMCQKALVSIEKKLDSLIPEFENLWSTYLQALEIINCNNFITLFNKYLQNANLEAESIAYNIINSTEKLYAVLLEKYANSFNLSVNDLTYADILTIVNFNHVNENPPATLSLKCLQTLLDDLKINHLLEPIKYVIPKSTNEFKLAPCDYICPLIPIDNIYIFTIPIPNFSFYKRLFYCFGKSAILSAARSNNPVEFIYFGDPSLRYGYAYLFSVLLSNRQFQSLFFAPKEMDVSEEKLLLAELIMLRKIAAEAIYENKIINYPINAPLSNLAIDFNNLMKSTLFIDVPSPFFLFNKDHNFKAIYAIRGIAFAYILTHHLQNKFGKKWFTNKKAGFFLMELFECGSLYPINELIKDWGYFELNLDFNECILDNIYQNNINLLK